MSFPLRVRAKLRSLGMFADEPLEPGRILKAKHNLSNRIRLTLIHYSPPQMFGSFTRCVTQLYGSNALAIRLATVCSESPPN